MLVFPLVPSVHPMELFSLQYLIFCLLFIYISLRFYLSHTKPKHGFKTYPLVGVLPEFLKNRHRFLEWTTDVLRRCPTHTAELWRPGGVRGVMTANPANVEHMLKTNFLNYPKGDRFIYLLTDFLGRGIFNSDGHLWRVQRKTASHEFSTASLRNFVIQTITFEIRARLVPALEAASAAHRQVDLQDLLERFAFDNVCKLAFDVDPSCLSADGGDSGCGGEGAFMRAFEEAATLSAKRFMYAFPYLWRIKRFYDVGTERRLRKSISTVHEFADKIVRSRLEDRERRISISGEDLLSRFIHNSDGDSESESSDFLRDVVISFILAGRDTTSSALSWFFWLLSSNPRAEARILEELGAIRRRSGARAGDVPRFDELREMNYLHAAISEAMRLYPAVPVDTKECLHDDVFPDGTWVGKGWFVTYHTYAMGRMESVWGKDCREFRPERWLDEGGACRQESACKFPVFHAGPRMCLGKDMAYIQMKCIAAAVIERFEINVTSKDTLPEHVLSLTLRMKGGLHVKVTERSGL